VLMTSTEQSDSFIRSRIGFKVSSWHNAIRPANPDTGRIRIRDVGAESAGRLVLIVSLRLNPQLSQIRCPPASPERERPACHARHERAGGGQASAMRWIAVSKKRFF
jgi:hypothetical protein